ncbi:MAG: hypothetical protein JWQ30_1019 [Sediminibacterium sp.]|nr:hypothetical protein [Sediminibacterium sp.]
MKKNISLAAFLTVVMIIVLRWQGNSLVNTTSPGGIVNLEFAYTPQRLLELLSHWDITAVKTNIWLDFLFIISYTLFLSVAAELCSERWPENSVPRQAGLFFAKMAYLAGIFDIAENLLMMQSIEGNYTITLLQFTFYFAAIKFVLAGIIVIYLLASLPFIIRKK